MSIQFKAMTENGQCAVLTGCSFCTLNKRCEDASHSQTVREIDPPFGMRFDAVSCEWVRVLALLLWSGSGLAGGLDSGLQCNTMTGVRGLRRRACTDLFCPFGVLMVWVLI